MSAAATAGGSPALCVHLFLRCPKPSLECQARLTFERHAAAFYSTTGTLPNSRSAPFLPRRVFFKHRDNCFFPSWSYVCGLALVQVRAAAPPRTRQHSRCTRTHTWASEHHVMG